MKNYFKKISKLCIGGRDVPQKIIDKIIEYHAEPMNVVRHHLGVWITASLESGFRPYWWEIANGRNGGSQHCFGQKKSGIIYASEKGAIDWTCKDFKYHWKEMLELIIKHTEYTRIAVYKGFIHCDYKATPSGMREVYKSNSKSEWELTRKIAA